jgi:DNA mismatch repair protein MutS
LHCDEQIVALLQRSIRDEPAALLREGGVIRDGYDAGLDELRGIQTNCGDFLLRWKRGEGTHRLSPI